jgi:hypothetical protein
MLKKFLLPSLIIALLLVSMLVVPQASAKPDPFIGVWTSIDVDGSSQTLTIGGGSGEPVRYASMTMEPPSAGWTLIRVISCPPHLRAVRFRSQAIRYQETCPFIARRPRLLSLGTSTSYTPTTRPLIH